jgi:hypothetical protein
MELNNLSEKCNGYKQSETIVNILKLMPSLTLIKFKFDSNISLNSVIELLDCEVCKNYSNIRNFAYLHIINRINYYISI